MHKKGYKMSTYTIPDLISQWAKGDLTPEQARPKGTRHLLQNLLAQANHQVDLSIRQSEFEQRLRLLEQPPMHRKP